MINDQYLQSSNLQTNATSLLQYTHLWWRLTIEQEILGNLLILEVLSTNSRRIS